MSSSVFQQRINAAQKRERSPLIMDSSRNILSQLSKSNSGALKKTLFHLLQSNSNFQDLVMSTMDSFLRKAVSQSPSRVATSGQRPSSTLTGAPAIENSAYSISQIEYYQAFGVGSEVYPPIGSFSDSSASGGRLEVSYPQLADLRIEPLSNSDREHDAKTIQRQKTAESALEGVKKRRRNRTKIVMGTRMLTDEEFLLLQRRLSQTQNAKSSNVKTKQVPKHREGLKISDLVC